MPVNRCVCHDVSFRTLIDLAHAKPCTIDELADKTGATTGCGTCLPYLKLALATRQPDLPVMSQRDLEAAIQAATTNSNLTRDHNA